jgi:ufm1-conjugating enzyme 1
MDANTKAVLQKIPLLKTRAGPRDGDQWVQRLKEEFEALIKYVEINKDNDNDWFFIEPNKLGTRWTGKCWYVHNYKKYEFDLEFEVSMRESDFWCLLCLCACCAAVSL